jgi:type IV secretion system protein VirD4
MAILGIIGLWLLADARKYPGVGTLGLIFVAVGVVYFVNVLFIKRARAHRSAARGRRQLQDWYESRPQLALGRAPDALVAVRDLTWSQGGGAFLGITPDLREWATADREQAVLVLGPPRSGKTGSIIIPSVLNAAGAVVSTATKRDVMEATYRSRSRYGRVWLFDPSGQEALPEGVLRLQWTPVWSARTWDGARTMAEAMVNASAVASTSGGSGSENAYWTESSKGLLGPMLHAAALSGRSIGDVRHWILHEDYATPGAILVEHGAMLAADDLVRIAHTEDRERGSVVNTTATVLRAYGSQSALNGCANPNFDVDRFAASFDTIYVTAPAQQQEMMAPLVVGLLEEIREAVYRRARASDRAGRARQATMLWALDEIANIAPIKNLPAIVSEGGGQGLQLMACFQDLTQASVRWGRAADGFLTLFGTKVVFPGIGDRQTLEALSMMVGDWDRPYVVTGDNFSQSSGFMQNTITYGASTSYSTQREALLSPSEIANIPRGHALIVRAGRWGLVEHTPYYSALPWVAVLAQSPQVVEPHGGPDVLPAAEGKQAGATLPKQAVTGSPAPAPAPPEAAV